MRPITDITTPDQADHDLAEVLVHLKMTRGILLGMVPGLQAMTQKPADLIKAETPSSDRTSQRAVDVVNRYALPRWGQLTYIPDPQRFVTDVCNSWRNNTGRYPKAQYELVPKGEESDETDLVLRAGRLMDSTAHLMERYRLIGMKYGEMLKEKPSDGDGLYVRANTNRRDVTGEMNAGKRSKTSYIVTPDMMAGFSPASWLPVVGSIGSLTSDIAEWMQNTTLGIMWRGGQRAQISRMVPKHTTPVRFYTSPTDLVVLLPRQLSRARVTATPEIWAAVHEVADELVKDSKDVNAWAEANRDLWDKMAVGKSNRARVTLDDEAINSWVWNSISVEQDRLLRQVILAMKADLGQERCDEIIDSVLGPVADLTPAEIAEFGSRDVRLTESGRFSEVIREYWDRYTAAHPTLPTLNW